MGGVSGWSVVVRAPPWSVTRRRWRHACGSIWILALIASSCPGYPHLEECYRFAELVFPLLPLKATTGNDLGPANHRGPFGEIIANVAAPTRHAAG